MSIRFCEFCSTVHPDEATHCPACGTRLAQTTSEEQFNDPTNPWPFTPISDIRLVIQGKPRQISFSGTHSVYHLWTQMHTAYESGALYFRERGDELELACFPEGQHHEEYHLLEPVTIMACNQNRFSLYTYEEIDPELEVVSEQAEGEEITPAPEEKEGLLMMTYEGSFEIPDCPDRFRKDILGWLIATNPYPELDNQWTYFMT